MYVNEGFNSVLDPNFETQVDLTIQKAHLKQSFLWTDTSLDMYRVG